MKTYRIKNFHNLTAQDVLDLIGFRLAKLTAEERKILPDRLTYLQLAEFFYSIRELLDQKDVTG